jgi:predicted transcriptional regulator
MANLQYTVRNVSSDLDRNLRQIARKKHQSLNETLLEALQASVGQAEYHDLDFVAGSWLEDADTAKALKDQRKIDKEMWQ